MDASPPLPPLSGLLAQIAPLPVRQIAGQLRRGDFSAVELIEAHLARIEQVDPLTNALPVKLADAAREDARRADRLLAKGEATGPLWGVPVTIKECFAVRGTSATMGLPSWRERIDPEDAPLVARLRAAGAIVLGKSNVPQLMALHETVNPLYGRTRNPHRTDRAAGGSSGGEAAAIASGCSPLGLGSDLGGSIRIPAHFCGVCGIKPTSRRLTRRGSVGGFRGMEGMLWQAGPLARWVDDLRLALEVFCREGAAEEDTELAARPLWPVGSVSVKGLRIGVLRSDGFFPPAPALRRVIEESANHLANLGAVVEDFTPRCLPEHVPIYAGLITADGGADLRELLGRDRREPLLARLLQIMSLPRWYRPIAAAVLELLGQRRAAQSLRATGPRSAAAYWKLVHRRAEFERAFAAEMTAGGFDAVVLPPHALPAMEHDQSVDLFAAAGYAFLPNVLGWPAGVTPASRVRPGEECDRARSRDWAEAAARRAELSSRGLPVGVQVLSKPWREDIVLVVLEALQSRFRLGPDYPAPGGGADGGSVSVGDDLGRGTNTPP